MDNTHSISGLTKIDIEGSQSVCYHQKIDCKNFFWKEYKSIVDKATLETYHTLHQQYGNIRHQVFLDNILKTNGVTVSQVSFVILPLSCEQISSAIKINEKSETIISNIPYIAGITLDEYYAQLMGKNNLASKMKCMLILHAVEKGLLQLFNHSIMHGLSPTNMKVISVKNGVMYTVITDLAIRIPEYIASYKQSS